MIYDILNSEFYFYYIRKDFLMIKHIVVWRLNENADKEKNALEIKKQLEALKDKIDFIVDIHVGLNFNTTEAASDVVLESVFKTREDLQSYQSHPAHVAVGKDYVRPNVSERRVIDYEF